MTAILETKNVTVHYGGVRAIDGISLHIEKGTIVALLGSNGAGKSTIVRTIFGLKKPTNGEVWFNGKRIDGLHPTQVVKAGIAYSIEGRRLFPHLSVLENLEMGAYTRKDKAKIKIDINEMYSYFPILGERKKQAAGTLSGGEQQMLSIARALMSRPKLLLLDEPTLGLAPLVVKELASIVKLINKSGISVLLVEQNSKVGLDLANRGYVLEVGSVVLEGDAKELVQNEHIKKIYLGY